MKRLTKTGIAVAAVLAAAVALGAALAWLAATPAGTRWSLETASRTSGNRISWQKIDGTLGDHLSLKGVRLRLPQLQVELDSVELDWQPLLLLSGTVAIRELSLAGVRIQDDTPPDNKPPELAWPTAPDTAQLLDVAIARLRLNGFSYRLRQEPPIEVMSLTTTLTWQDDHLSLTDLILTSAAGQLRGSAAFGLKRPELTADLAITLAEPVATLDQVTLRARPTVIGGPEAVSAALTLVGFAGRVKLLELGGNVAMAKTALQLRRLHLARAGQAGIITADGALAFTALETLLTLQLKVAGLDLAPQVNVPTDLSGTLSLAGTMDSYRGSFALANKAGNWQAATVAGAYRGSASGLELAPLTLTALDGTVAGKVALDWRDGFKVHATLDGRDLNPARVAPDWHGVANFRATGDVAWREQAPVSGSVTASLLESRLHGQALTGKVQADFVGADLTIDHLTLQGKGFELQAAGELRSKLSVAAQINDLSRLVPGAAGAATGHGWLRRQGDRLSGSGAGSGTGLAWGGATIAGANLTARLEQGQDNPLHVAATLHDVAYDRYRINAVTVAADGNMARHNVKISLRSAAAAAELTLSAGYQAAVWQGTLAAITGSDAAGTWQLVAPASFAISSAKLYLAPLALTSSAKEHLELTADLALSPLSGRISAGWTNVNVARANSLLQGRLSGADITVAGRSSGRASAVLLPGQRFTLDGSAVLTEGAVQQQNASELKLTGVTANASWRWQEDTLRSSLLLTAPAYGQLRAADIQLPLAARFPLAVTPHGPLKGKLVGNLHDKGIISAIFPDLIQNSSGEITANLAVGGTWQQPQLSGTAQLSGSELYLPTAGIYLKDIRLTAHLDKNLLRIDSLRAASGPGHIEASGLITLADWQLVSYQGTLRGDNFQTVYFPELRLLCTPELTFSGTPQKLTLRGNVKIPELHIDGLPSHQALAPSSDAIVAGRTMMTAPVQKLALDVQLQLLLGERVYVKVAGIDAQLGGAVEVSLTSLDRITSRGEIKVVKGNYRTYGVNLDINRGRLFFAGGPIDQPGLDVLALRTIGTIRAGVLVSGTLVNPVTKLYSEPPLPDVDILAYIVLGHPFGSSGEQVGLLTQAAGALLTSGQAEDVQKQIKSRLGLSTLEIQDGVGGAKSPMGYKPLPVTAPGTIPATQQPDVTETVLTVGKYLTPKLYISYGRSLFTGSSLFLLRYDISRQWQIETQTGSESGVDLFYKLEFK